MPDKSAPRHFRPWFNSSINESPPDHVTCSFLNVSQHSPYHQVGGYISLPADVAIGDTFEVAGQLYPEPITLRVVDVRPQVGENATLAGQHSLTIYAEQIIP